MDTFGFHPPSLSHSPAQPHPADDAALAAAAAFAARPGSSSGAGPSTGFTQTLPPLHEHVSSESVPTATGAGAAPGRPTLVGFEQLTGEDPHVGPSRAAYGGGEGQDAAAAGAEAHSLGGGFRDPFPGSSSSSSAAAAAVNPYAQAPHAHSFFNPHPNVNMRNTRPMTAPSGPSYFNSPSYSAAPSAFYAPALQQQQHPHQQHTSANAASTYGALDLAPAPPPLVAPGSSQGHSTFQYSVDTSPNLDYDAFRARGFSLPDMAGAGASDPAGPDSASPTSSSTPFFYTPPSITPGSTLRTLQPAPPPPPPHADGYYPAVLDPAQALMPAPLAASTSAILPPASDLPPPPAAFLQQQRPQTGPTPSTRRGSTGGSGGGGGGSGAAGKQYNFVQQAGQSSKRPRRRFDEIERMYNCDYPGCTKAYGTLNHLNSHKTMQKHGPKSTPAQFKEMRKAWRERKKAEAASAARDRAAQPQPPPAPPSALGPPPGAGANGLPSALGLPPHLNDRPRPSTSAGEYHFSMPAPFMTPLGAPMLAYPPPPPAAVPQPAPQGMFDAPLPHPPHAPHGYDGEAAAAAGGFGLHDPYGGGAGGASAMRPVTAPSYYVAPQFGSSMASSSSSGLSSHPLAQPPTTAGSYVPPRLVSGQAGGAGFGVGASAMGGDRRFSLPSSSLGYGPPQPGHHYHLPQQEALKRFYRQQQQHEQDQQLQQQHDAQRQQQQPATTLEMPRPVLAGPNGYSALIHGGVTAAQAGGAADGGPGKLGGEDGGSFEEIAAQ